MTTPPSTCTRPSPWERAVPPEPSDGRTRVVVVCAANLARSPLVERLLQAGLDARAPGRFAVSSCGVRVLERGAMVPGVRRMLRDRGLDASGHRASPLQATRLRGATLVLTAEEAHSVAVLERVPALLNRTFTVLEFAAIARHHRARGLDPAGLLQRAGSLRAAVTAEGGDRDLIDPVGPDPARLGALEAQLGDAVTVIADALAATRG
ncbi:hypothetical protein DEI93_14585 [Curtobacterium sp. MCBD17_035]|uniref:arsenate reductase/protein-tyrosine-phosphatase family protein n=1 Tax=Curtobacterium sp. MCBD17_035 TaxID=2175673 RepID=UPI000DAA0982|nr:hypothetical protein [Curtobacterium sp. MCBD17_035]WIB67164.1 hypothetical protein DEI93_14585 [Curtobacterium sp. MCBD17_035]